MVASHSFQPRDRPPLARCLLSTRLLRHGHQCALGGYRSVSRTSPGPRPPSVDRWGCKAAGCCSAFALGPLVEPRFALVRDCKCKDMVLPTPEVARPRVHRSLRTPGRRPSPARAVPDLASVHLARPGGDLVRRRGRRGPCSRLLLVYGVAGAWDEPLRSNTSRHAAHLVVTSRFERL